ncbi:MAG: flavodoxin family protein [Tidjanibacter sp.]|nr:flavodoxin family protein [Tidjanibacter sp.]
MKNILIISSSPRHKSNSEALCDEFMRGATETGNSVEKLRLADYTIGFCNGCDLCSTYGKPCPQKDDAAQIIEKMISADVIVLATPLYFYAMSAQLKTLIDRCCGLYTRISDKEFYCIVTAADNAPEQAERAVTNIGGFFDCLSGATLKGTVYGLGVWHAGEIAGNYALTEAYRMGAEVK